MKTTTEDDVHWVIGIFATLVFIALGMLATVWYGFTLKTIIDLVFVPVFGFGSISTMQGAAAIIVTGFMFGVHVIPLEISRIMDNENPKTSTTHRLTKHVTTIFATSVLYCPTALAVAYVFSKLFIK